jgi:hypothetical protein
MLTLLVFSACFSSFATALLAGFWSNLLDVRPKRGLGLTLRSVLLVLGICVYFTIVSTVFVIMVAVAPFPNIASVFVGLIAAGTFIVGIVVLVLGLLVIQKLKKAAKFRALKEKDLRRMTKVRIYVIGFAVAQCLCAVGEFTITFFSAELIADGEKWIWLAVCYPGLLYGLAYFFILFALRRKPKAIHSPPSSSGAPQLRDVAGPSGQILLEETS